MLSDLLDDFIQEISIITNNVVNYVTVGKVLMERHPALFWTPYVIHHIDLILDNVEKIYLIKDVIDLARSITKFMSYFPCNEDSPPPL